MQITSAKFIKGIVGFDEILNSGIPQIAVIGRSNAGKSSLINSLTKSKKLAITSKTPGRTREINIFLINNSHYLVDLPGYGYAKADGSTIKTISDLISWYLFESNINYKAVLLVDSVVGPTKDDFGILEELEKHNKEVLIVANKVDKIKKSHYKNQLKKISEQVPNHMIIPYSSKTGIGQAELANELFAESS